MIAADFFSGLGGFSEGARQAGASVEFAANHWDSACKWHGANHPETILVENVPDFLRWGLFPQWRGSLESLGYAVREHVLEANRYGSAQARSRMILTARQGAALHLAPDWGTERRILEDCIDWDGEHRWSRVAAKSDRMRSRMRKAQGEAGARCIWNNVSESRGRPLDGLAPTLTTKSGSQLYLLDGERARILNPRELARIQGFPEGYAIPKNRELASKLIGNAIDVHLARGVIEQAIK